MMPACLSDSIFYLDMKLFNPSAHSCSQEQQQLLFGNQITTTCSFLPSSICLPAILPSSSDSVFYQYRSAAALIMARLPVQLSMQLTIYIMMLSSFSSIFLSLSDAARAATFAKGLDAVQKKNTAYMPRMRWLTGGVGAESFNGQMSVVHAPDVSSSSAVGSTSNIEANEMQTVQELNLHLKPEESRTGAFYDIVGTPKLAGDNDQLQRRNPVMARSSGGSQSAAWPFHEEEDEYLQLLQKFFLLNRANPVLGMWQITDDEESNFRNLALVLTAILRVSTDREAQALPEDSFPEFPRMKEVNLPKTKSLQADISRPGHQRNDGQLDTKAGSRALLADISPPGIWTEAEINGSQFQKRRLLADISPPGMWSDDGDDMQDKYHKRRLLADTSPPGNVAKN